MQRRHTTHEEDGCSALPGRHGPRYLSAWDGTAFPQAAVARQVVTDVDAPGRSSGGVLSRLDSTAAAAVLLALNRAGGNASVQGLVREADHRGRLPARPFHQPVVQRAPPQIVKRGKVEHTGAVGKVPPGRTDHVEVRTGEEVALSSGKKVPNMIALVYSGADAEKSKWLQFVWFELVATAPDKVTTGTGTFPMLSGKDLPLTTEPEKSPVWGVDGGADDPFYEAPGAATSGGLNIRNASTSTIFDDPGGDSALSMAESLSAARPKATEVVFRAHFDSYLMQPQKSGLIATYHVSWVATTKFTKGGSSGTLTTGDVKYDVGASGPVKALPAGLRRVLTANYKNITGIQ